MAIGDRFQIDNKKNNKKLKESRAYVIGLFLLLYIMEILVNL